MYQDRQVGRPMPGDMSAVQQQQSQQPQASEIGQRLPPQSPDGMGLHHRMMNSAMMRMTGAASYEGMIRGQTMQQSPRMSQQQQLQQQPMMRPWRVPGLQMAGHMPPSHGMRVSYPGGSGGPGQMHQQQMMEGLAMSMSENRHLMARTPGDGPFGPGMQMPPHHPMMANAHQVGIGLGGSAEHGNESLKLVEEKSDDQIEDLLGRTIFFIKLYKLISIFALIR